MGRLVYASLMFLMGCSSPAMEFMGAPVSRQLIDGWQIDVYARGDKAQAIRLSTDFGATRAKMADRGSVAIQQATGCDIKPGSAIGDQAVMTVKLSCKR